MRRFDKPILVTRPYFPPIDEFRAGCEEIWENQWLTNNGPMVSKVTQRQSYLVYQITVDAVG